MSKASISALILETEKGYLLKSPSVGRVRLFVKDGDIIAGGEVIGYFWRLNQRFLLTAPNGLQGRVVSHKNHEKIIALGYGEELLELARELSEVDRLGSNKTTVRKNDDAGVFIDAPMDGMFYLSPTPKDPPFVKVGDQIHPGQTIGLIEVMKCFYPLKFQGSKNAKITGVSIKNATPVNCGTKLYKIDA